MRLAALLIVVATTTATAQDLRYDPGVTLGCLAGTTVSERCVGAAARACMDETSGGRTTVGMGGCLDAERRFWDDRLNAAYGPLRAAHRAGGEGPRADALRDMQRAWIAYRDAACTYERMGWLGGTGGDPATAECLMEATARQALVLERWLRAERAR
ncbi:lysozyme inhibitor LprI family protein [Jannaschia sp. LMIT008]|uniref:lysozyme inhibitor LprI family protein n=1 Tax=Jannaschia maritima TaxID=3032585 RepID=UPI00281102D1|nr:lysozyme inhibitor LprI family protein [Jannaschia sp. LMIT008]